MAPRSPKMFRVAIIPQDRSQPVRIETIRGTHTLDYMTDVVGERPDIISLDRIVSLMWVGGSANAREGSVVNVRASSVKHTFTEQTEVIYGDVGMTGIAGDLLDEVIAVLLNSNEAQEEETL